MTIEANLNIFAIVPAAGTGSRMKSNLPKQYITINQKTVLEHTLNKLSYIKNINSITVAISPDDEFYQDLKIENPKIQTVYGGNSRAISVLNALNSLNTDTKKKPDWVLVHDAARPLVCPDDINKLINLAISKQKGGILACKVKDTIKKSVGKMQLDCVSETVSREFLWQAMTPQIFKFEQLHQALSDALTQNIDITDEASAMEWAGFEVMLVAGRSDNIKITTPEDLQLANFYLSQKKSKLE
ncbi:2-C-methyl-D-erythritol 4-phosphate cytidylyltransferase [Pseudoalteromonas denitrificans]|uniref:2-C-methyl-D-erythritol 4-phosphate cytidylyltransferase n=1 Tax=Pseudoalteromonas denitrificans DSM 6059 TaxID=1123010 RepID=A0A1I1EKH0_9GAMM|nr:2-C-methyl-D-erythritol 4-phosphate cytidylyltransferase [Pseudoalteromonas denitrificans]SFB87136.1 2-C-methyl-D-erythritol 4-phosphate cytidylyltransferase [Pseudoalteromonas denitrificans DSM 6059]